MGGSTDPCSLNLGIQWTHVAVFLRETVTIRYKSVWSTWLRTEKWYVGNQTLGLKSRAVTYIIEIILLAINSTYTGISNEYKDSSSMFLTNLVLHYEGVWGIGCTEPQFLDLGTSWTSVVNFTPRPLYPRCPLIGGLVDHRAGLDDVKILDSTGTRTPTPRSSSP
jgi:hypothetical protein